MLSFKLCCSKAVWYPQLFWIIWCILWLRLCGSPQRQPQRHCCNGWGSWTSPSHLIRGEYLWSYYFWIYFNGRFCCSDATTATVEKCWFYLCNVFYKVRYVNVSDQNSASEISEQRPLVEQYGNAKTARAAEFLVCLVSVTVSFF